MKTRSAIGASIAVLAVFVTGACGQEEHGVPVAQTGNSAEKSPHSSQRNESAGDLVSGIEACDLLAPITSKRGFDDVEEYTPPGVVSGCMATHDDEGVTGISLRDLPIEDLPADFGPVEDARIGERAAKKREATGDCVIAIKISEDERADLNATMSADEPEPCADAEEMAEELEPNLPQG